MATQNTRGSAAKKRTSSTTTRKATGTAKRTSGRSTTGTSRKKSSAKKKGASGGDALIEVMIYILLGVSLILFISNFGVAGAVGGFLSAIQFGTFGVMAYIFPVCLFMGILFLMSNRYSGVARIKLLAVALCCVCICGIIEMISANYEVFEKLSMYYNFKAPVKKGGGIIGGAICKLLTVAFGEIGAYIIIILFIIISLVLISERSLIRGIKGAISNAFVSAKDDISEYREVSEQKRIIREEKKEVKKEEKERNKRYTQQIQKLDFTKDNTKPQKRLDTIQNISFERNVSNEEEFDDYEALDSKDNYENDYQVEEQEDIAYNYEESDTESGNEVEEEKPVRVKKGFLGVVSDDVKEVFKSSKYREDIMDITAAEADADEYEPIPEFESYDKDEYEPINDFSLYASDDKGVNSNDVFARETLEQIKNQPAKVFEEDNISADNDYLAEDYEDEYEDEYEALDYPETDVLREVSHNSSGNVKKSNNVSDDGRTKEQVDAEINAQVKQSEQLDEIIEAEYQFPPIELLQRGKSGRGTSEKELHDTAMKLQQTLANFGVRVTVNNVSCGPAVTRYEIQPEQGVKVSKIVSLADDIKLNLAAADIRIEAPIPGKAAVGIEVPNKENVGVSIRELLESKAFKESASPISFGVGKDIGGQVVVADIAKMPHVLIAGATGSGKSVCINTIIMSILYKAKPSEVKLIMIDPKVVELSVYNGIPHLMIPVVTDPKKAAGALNWAVTEMMDRYKKFENCGVRDLKGYNAKVEALKDIQDNNKPVKLPQLVIIVDELADLMMVSKSEVEDAIVRLAQLARAAGIHLVIATQRPSVDVITGLIKANVPSRISFAVSSGVDSRTIIDMVGAEKLLGRGDMLFMPAGYPKPARVQGAFVSDNEVSSVVEFLAANCSQTGGYSNDVSEKINNPGSSGGGTSSEEYDAYFAQAGKFLIEKGRGSIGMLQRLYRIGFNRAARIMDQLELAGVVGPEEGTKPRKILMSMEEFEDFLENM